MTRDFTEVAGANKVVSVEFLNQNLQKLINGLEDGTYGQIHIYEQVSTLSAVVGGRRDVDLSSTLLAKMVLYTDYTTADTAGAGEDDGESQSELMYNSSHYGPSGLYDLIKKMRTYEAEAITGFGFLLVAGGTADGDIIYTAVDLGSGSTAITITHTVSGVGTTRLISVVGTDITVRVATTAAVAATGTLTVVAKASLLDNETFTLTDGANAATVFEYQVTGGFSPTGGGVVVINVTTDTTDAEVALRTRTAINGVVGGLAITAAAPTGAVIPLTNDATGTAGNVAITDTVVNAGFTHTGMSGGSAGGAVAATETGTSIAASVNADVTAAALVSAAAQGTGLGLTAAKVQTALSAGSDASTSGPHVIAIKRTINDTAPRVAIVSQVFASAIGL